MKKKFWILLLVTISLHAKKLLIIDTHGGQKDDYKTLVTLSSARGYTVDFAPFYAIPKSLESYNTVLLIINRPALSHMDHPFIAQMLKKIHTFTQLNHKKVGLFLPNIPNKAPLIEATKQFLLQCGVPEDHSLQAFIPYERNAKWNTALIPAQETTPEALDQIPYIQKISGQESEPELLINACLLTKKISATRPYGLLFEQANNTKIFVTHAKYATFADMRESFVYNPISPQLRESLLTILSNMLDKLLKDESSGTSTSSTSQTLDSQKLPHELTAAYMLEQFKEAQNNRKQTVDERYEWIEKEKIRAGWLDLEAYDGNALEPGIDALIKSRLNLLWIRFNPERYLSNRGIDKKNIELFKARISNFTEKLKMVCSKYEAPLPKIFAGSEITSNFHHKNGQPAQHPAVTIFGKTLPNVPSQFDHQFWKEELIDVCKQFVTDWKTLGNGIPLSGFFFDFEMYQAQSQASNYSDLLGFSKTGIINFLKKKGITLSADADEWNDAEHINYLYKKNLLNDYAQNIEKEAKRLGADLRTQLEKLLPGGIIAAYNMTLPASRFYKGLLAGLSTPKKPLIYATFNNDYYSHYPYLKQQGINCYHLPVMLLSKFQKDTDATLMHQLLPYNDGIWFNRFSRIRKPYDPKKWWKLESTPYDHEKIIQAIADIPSS